MGGRYVMEIRAANYFTGSEHGGTHLDAPVHFSQTGQTVEAIPLAFENLSNLDQLPRRGASIIALPMKIGGGSGGPLRAIAIVPEP